MRSRIVLFTACLLVASHALAQTPPRPAKPPAAPAAPAPPAASAPAPPPAPPAPPAPRKEGQPINVRVELTITETGTSGPPVRKSVVAVVADSFSGYVREQAVGQPTAVPGQPFDRLVAPLNLDATPTILPNGKIRLVCTIQYQSTSTQRPAQDRTINTDIKQNLVLNLESGKMLVISEAADPVIPDRRVTVEVTATILK